MNATPATKKNKTILMCCAVFVLAVVTAPDTSHAGPWTKTWGELYAKVGENFFVSDNYIDATGARVEGVNYLGATSALYLEVGLPLGFQLHSYLPLVVARNNTDDGASYLRVSGGDAQIGVQYTPHFVKLPFPAALKVDVKVPFYDLYSVTGSLANNFPAPGDGQLDVTVWLSAGGGLHSLGVPLYLFAEAGYRHRADDPIGTDPVTAPRQFEDGFAFFAQVGYTFFERVLLAVNVGGIVPFDIRKAQDVSPATADPGYTPVTKGYITVGPALYIPVVEGLAVEANYDPVVWAHLSAKGHGFSVGLSFKR